MILRNRKEKKNLREDAPLWKIVSKKTGLTQSRKAGLMPSYAISNVILTGTWQNPVHTCPKAHRV
jgi:hypothetical protein